jgi:ketosteroid isomerase-like protein
MPNAQALRVPKVDPVSEIRNSIDGFIRALESKDLDAILTYYAPDIVAFDMMPPLQYLGIKSWGEVWKRSLDMMKGEIKAEIRDLSIDVNGDLAICHGLNHFVLTGEDNVDMWFRWTASMRQINGKWLVTHEHTSVPGDMETGKTLTDLKP